ncbi:hypothetical protein ACJJI3_02365 [Microbulbifer sp. ZKSA004]|uniref:hypothetical protein n=1 Tax=Microbulbifer sp. ZKSA004 TaxID=3243389 RepID=UPI00403A3442
MRKTQKLLVSLVFVVLSLWSVSLQAASFKVVSHNVWSGFTSFYDLNVDGKPEGPFNVSCADNYDKFKRRIDAYLGYLSGEVGKNENFIIAFQEMDNKTKRTCGGDYSLTWEIDKYFSPGVENRFFGLVQMDGWETYNNSQSHAAVAGVYNGNAIVASPDILQTMYERGDIEVRIEGKKINIYFLEDILLLYWKLSQESSFGL